ncbi:hypothetical protein [Sphingomonas sp. 28-62-20]|uniref:hypothetical protein n=1 Tax=Sphingomonas sp. 28-62-20 TaxID=1970433 RepID=UPI0035A9250B
MVIGFFVGDKFVNVLCDFLHGLDKFWLSYITFLYAFHEDGKINMIRCSHYHSPNPNKDKYLHELWRNVAAAESLYIALAWAAYFLRFPVLARGERSFGYLGQQPLTNLLKTNKLFRLRNALVAHWPKTASNRGAGRLNLWQRGRAGRLQATIKLGARAEFEGGKNT